LALVVRVEGKLRLGPLVLLVPALAPHRVAERAIQCYVHVQGTDVVAVHVVEEAHTLGTGDGRRRGEELSLLALTPWCRRLNVHVVTCCNENCHFNRHSNEVMIIMSMEVMLSVINKTMHYASEH